MQTRVTPLSIPHSLLTHSTRSPSPLLRSSTLTPSPSLTHPLPPKMNDNRQYPPRRPAGPNPATNPTATTGSFLQRLRDHSPNSTQLIGFATLVVSGGILLLLTGLTLTAVVLSLIFFAPLILISSPIWVPVGFLIFVTIAGFLSFAGFGVASVAAMSWLYRYFRGFHPPGSDRLDYARTRIADTASHVKDYAGGYGRYMHGKVKDAAPGA